MFSVHSIHRSTDCKADQGASSSTSLAAGRSEFTSTQGQVEPVDWSTGPGPLAAGGNPLAGNGNGHSVVANSRSLGYGSGSAGIHINLTTIVPDGGSLTDAETTGEISVNANADSGGMDDGDVNIDVQTSDVHADGSSFAYLTTSSSGDSNGTAEFGFDADLSLDSTDNSTENDSEWNIELFSFSSESNGGGDYSLNFIDQSQLGAPDNGDEYQTKLTTYTETSNVTTSGSVGLDLDGLTFAFDLESTSDTNYDSDVMHLDYLKTRTAIMANTATSSISTTSPASPVTKQRSASPTTAPTAWTPRLNQRATGPTTASPPTNTSKAPSTSKSPGPVTPTQ